MLTRYTAEFKTKLVLEVLKGEKTLNEIASAELAMEPSKAVKEYKEQVVELQAKVVGKITVERD